MERYASEPKGIRLSKKQRLVATYLLDHKDHREVVYKNYNIAEWCGCAYSGVTTALTILKALGVIEVYNKSVKGYYNKIYITNINALYRLSEGDVVTPEEVAEYGW